MYFGEGGWGCVEVWVDTWGDRYGEYETSLRVQDNAFNEARHGRVVAQTRHIKDKQKS